MPTLPRDVLLQLDREYSSRSLANFAKRAWHVLHPHVPLLWNWSLDAISDHVMAAYRGDARTVIINAVPGLAKTMFSGILGPAWQWGPAGNPGWRFLWVTHEDSFALNVSTKCRALIESPWYRARWSEVQIKKGSNRQDIYETTEGGERVAKSQRSTMTGRRPDTRIADDLIKPEDVYSPTALERARRILADTLTTRVNNPETSCMLLNMQRICRGDPTDMLLEADPDAIVLRLPMEFDSRKISISSVRPYRYQGPEQAQYRHDPRTEDGELIWPERFGRDYVECEFRGKMSTHAYAAQMQQEPMAGSGEFFKREMAPVIDAYPLKDVRRRVRRWDLAATVPKPGSDPDWTVGLRLSQDTNMLWYVESVVRFRGSSDEVQRRIVATAAQDKAEFPNTRVTIGLPQDPGAGGKAWVSDLVRALAGYTVEVVRETASKQERAAVAVAQWNFGHVHVLKAPWTREFLDEVEAFPAGRHDDQVDALSGAFDLIQSGLRVAPQVSMMRG